MRKLHRNSIMHRNSKGNLKVGQGSEKGKGRGPCGEWKGGQNRPDSQTDSTPEPTGNAALSPS